MAEEAQEDVPVIYLHEIKREYKQGEATLTILNGAKLALWAGQSVALVAPSRIVSGTSPCKYCRFISWR